MNGDGRPDIFVAGYSDPNVPVPGSLAGFPTNLAGVRDLLFLNEGGASLPRGRDPGGPRVRELPAWARRGVRRRQRRRPSRPLRRERRGSELPLRERPVARRRKGGSGRPRLPLRGSRPGVGRRRPVRGHGRSRRLRIATPLRDELARRAVGGVPRTRASGTFANARPSFDPALGVGFAGWGASFVDLANSGTPDLVLAAGAIPVTSLARDAEPVQVLAPLSGRLVHGSASLQACSAPGCGSTAAVSRPPTSDNDGRMDIAVNTIGGKLVLLRPSGPSGHWLDVALVAVLPGRGRDRHAPGRANARARPFRPAAATSPPRTRASTSASARRGQSPG